MNSDMAHVSSDYIFAKRLRICIYRYVYIEIYRYVCTNRVTYSILVLRHSDHMMQFGSTIVRQLLLIPRTGGRLALFFES